ncbi:MAG: hypothetical protein GX936_10600 [Clostridiales bacterium]|nr:hypothetical protein [Clostridiales bacterium]
MKNITRPGDRNSYYLYRDHLIVRDRDSGIYTTYTSRGRLMADTQKAIKELINKEESSND